MTKEDALLSFYSHNAIKSSDINNDPLLKTMSDRIDEWLKSIDECDRDLFLRMVSKYNYVTHITAINRYAESVEQLKKHLNQYRIPLKNVLFITTAQRTTKRGSDNVKTDLHALTILDIDAEQIISANTRSLKIRLQTARAVVFVDDIVSTGFTLRDTIKDFVKRVDSYGLLDDFIAKNLFFICIVPTKTGLKHVVNKCKEIRLRITPIYVGEWETISAFKSDYIFSENEKGDVETKIKRYEELINREIEKDGKSYIFGFKQRKQLVSFYYNTPNNTLCSFWGQTAWHSPLFKRQNQPAPSSSNLKNNKKRKNNAAYQAGREKRERERDEQRKNETEELRGKIVEAYQRRDTESELDHFDRQLLGYLNEYPSALYPQIAQYLECTKENVDQRIQKLYNNGYIEISEKNTRIVTEKALDVISYSYQYKGNNYVLENFDTTELYIPEEPFFN